MPEHDQPTVCSGCGQELCHVCGACPCMEERDWACRNRYQHWKIPPE